MSICGIILVKRGRTLSAPIINHEAIHYAQQKELLFIFFFIFYALEFLLRYIQTGFKWHLAYRNISFEQEAYDQERDLNYLPKRKSYAWIKYI